MIKYILIGCCFCITHMPYAVLAQENSHGSILFYLHGKIVEDQGSEAFSERFGKYQYTEIVQAFEKTGFRVISEVRPPDTDRLKYAEKVAGQIRDLIRQGIKPSSITVVGASKGGVIAMTVSTLLQNPDLNFVLLANCNEGIRQSYDIRLCGRMLSIYEASDEIGGSCTAFFEDADCELISDEMRLETGLGHGFIYRPLDSWVKPAISWAFEKSIR
jgi:hypothetical protein